jgi:hypothetical protein
MATPRQTCRMHNDLKFNRIGLLVGKRNLGARVRHPARIMGTYCKTHNISPDDVDDTMYWDCWPKDTEDPDLE